MIWKDVLEYRQKRYRRSSLVKFVRPGRWFFHLCQEFCRFPQPNPVTHLRLFQQHRQDSAQPDAGKVKRCNSEKQKHLSTAKAGSWFRSCIIVFRELEKRHAGVTPSLRSIDDPALRAICGFPFRSCHRGLCVFGLDVVSAAQKYSWLFLLREGIVPRLAVRWGH